MKSNRFRKIFQAGQLTPLAGWSFILSVVILAMTLWSTSVRADSFTIDLDHVFSGGIPSGPTPYLTLTISDIAAGDGGGVQFTFHVSSGLDAANKISEWDLNVTSLGSGLDNTSFTYVSGQLVGSITVALGCCKADGDGFHDIEFDFPTSGDTFGAGEDSIYKIASSFGLTAANFVDLGTSSENGQYFSAAHIQGLNGTGDCVSGWVGGAGPLNNISGTNGGGSATGCTGDTSTTATQATSVPEPSTMFLLGSGLLVLARAARRKRS